MTDRMYKGQKIYECEWPKGEHSGRWTVQTYHHTGMPFRDAFCPHYQRLADAKAAINESLLLNAEAAE